MGKERDIDELFQEKLTNFEMVPDAKIWEAIESELDQKKRKRLVPIWLFRGAAASIIVLFSVLFFQKFGEGQTQQKDVIVEVESNESQTKKVIDSNQIKEAITIEVAESKKSQIFKNRVEATSTNIFKETYKSENSANKNAIIIKSELAIAKTNSKSKEINKLNTEQRNKVVKQEIVAETDSKLENDTLDNKAKNPFSLKKLEEVNIATKETTKSSWFVQPSIGLLSSRTPSDVSIVANSNDVKSENFSSYGLKFGVTLNEKWSIQSGLLSQKVSYQSNNISDLNGISETVAISESNLEAYPIKSLEDSLFSDDEVYDVEQSFNYIELPLELKYNILKIDKFHTNLVFGGSTYFLIGKNALINTDNVLISGETKNINDVNFSANVGLSFEYKLFDSFNFNVNPVVKKTFNTFSDTDFNPYQFGVYSGFIYKF